MFCCSSQVADVPRVPHYMLRVAKAKPAAWHTAPVPKAEHKYTRMKQFDQMRGDTKLDNTKTARRT